MKVTVYSNGFVVGDSCFDPLMALRRTRRFCAMLGGRAGELEDRAGAAPSIWNCRQARRGRGAGLYCSREAARHGLHNRGHLFGSFL